MLLAKPNKSTIYSSLAPQIQKRSWIAQRFQNQSFRSLSHCSSHCPLDAHVDMSNDTLGCLKKSLFEFMAAAFDEAGISQSAYNWVVKSPTLRFLTPQKWLS